MRKSGGRAAPTETPTAGADSAARTATSGHIPRSSLLKPQPTDCGDADGAPVAVHSHDGHLYSYVPTMTFESWHDARAAAGALRCCEAHGHLLVVSDEAEREFVRSHVVPHGATAWVGLVDEANDGVWNDGKEPGSTGSNTSSGSSSSITSSSTSPPAPSSSDQASPLTDCGTDSSHYYDDKDYLYGVRCREAARKPIVVEFDCPSHFR
jgi:Lectin C-type domain